MKITFYKIINTYRLPLAALCIITVILFAGNKPLAQDTNKTEDKFVVAAVGFYNVENLFDTINDPKIRDDDFTPEGSNRWNTAKYLEKLDNLSKVIDTLGTDYIPDGVAVLGLCEVENRAVLEDLANTERLKDRNYQIVHYPGPDRRGVDVAYFYNPKYFKYISSKPYSTRLEGLGRDGGDFRARDQLLLTGELMGERVHFLVAHWPSRAGGERRSRPLRNGCAQVARGIIDSILAVEPDAKIFMMGDLNDNPDNRSVARYLRSSGEREKLKESELFNPFYSYYKRGIGSNAWRDTWSLFDQILITQSMLTGDFSDFQYWKAEVYNRPFLVQPSGRFQGYPYRTFGGGVYLGGYSDHFPTLIYLIRRAEAKND